MLVAPSSSLGGGEGEGFVLVTPSSSLGGGEGEGSCWSLPPPWGKEGERFMLVTPSSSLGEGGGGVHVGHSSLLLPDSKKPGESELHEETWDGTWNETTLSTIHPTGHSQQETPPGVREVGERGVGHVEGGMGIRR